jgi:hypothetical protein
MMPVMRNQPRGKKPRRKEMAGQVLKEALAMLRVDAGSI